MKSMKTAKKTNKSPLFSACLCPAFTLIEILIVVIILGILAAIIIPKFSSASREARENMLRENLRVIRTQIGIYKAQHRDVAPGYPAGDIGQQPTEQEFVAQLTTFTDAQGNTNPVRTDIYHYGPYMLKMPENPINTLDTIEVLPDNADLPADADDSTGWILKPADAALFADCAGVDLSGNLYYSY